MFSYSNRTESNRGNALQREAQKLPRYSFETVHQSTRRVDDWVGRSIGGGCGLYKLFMQHSKPPSGSTGDQESFKTGVYICVSCNWLQLSTIVQLRKCKPGSNENESCMRVMRVLLNSHERGQRRIKSPRELTINTCSPSANVLKL